MLIANYLTWHHTVFKVLWLYLGSACTKMAVPIEKNVRKSLGMGDTKYLTGKFGSKYLYNR